MRVEYSKGERASKELILLHRQTSEATSGRKMKVMLIFPPDWYPSEPYLSLPSLTAVLRQAGHTVIQKDINLEMYDWYFSEDFLKKVLRRVPQQLDRLRKLAKKRELRRMGNGRAAGALRSDPAADRRADQEGGEGKGDHSRRRISMISTSWSGRLMCFARSRRSFHWSMLRRASACRRWKRICPTNPSSRRR